MSSSLETSSNDKNDVSTIAFDLFSDWQNFASTPCGFLFTVGTVILGVVAYIVLSQYNMDFIGAMIFAGSVFGDIAVGMVAGKLHKNGFFRCFSSDIDAKELNEKKLR